MGMLQTAFSLTTALVDRANIKKNLRRIDRANMNSRQLYCLGTVSANELLPDSSALGNLAVCGGDAYVRQKLMLRSCELAYLCGQPIVILHESDRELEQALRSAFGTTGRLSIVNASCPLYEPIIGLPIQDAVDLIADASAADEKLDTRAATYLRAIAELLTACGVAPRLRKFEACPHHTIQSVVAAAQARGAIDEMTAKRISNDLSDCSASRPAVERYLSRLIAHGEIICDKPLLSQSVSIRKCVSIRRILCIDVRSFADKTLIGLIAAELENTVLTAGARLMLHTHSFLNSERLARLITNSPALLEWSVFAPDAAVFLGTERSAAGTLLKRSHQAILFSHGVSASEILSEELGEYEHIEPNISAAANTGFGGFGFHTGCGRTVTTERRREHIIKSEELRNLPYGGFIRLDNRTGTVHQGVMI